MTSESPINKNKKWANEPIRMECKSAASQPNKRAIRPSKSARIFSAAIFLSTGHDQSVVLQPGEDRPNAPMIDGHCVSKCDSI